jgi:hypothetical protein
MQLEACRRALAHLAAEGRARARALIVVPLGVRQEFARDAGPDRLNLGVRRRASCSRRSSAGRRGST